MVWFSSKYIGSFATAKILLETGNPGGNFLYGSDIIDAVSASLQTNLAAVQNTANNASISAASALNTANNGVTSAANAQISANTAIATANDTASKAALRLNPTFTGNVTIDQSTNATLQILGTLQPRGPQIDFIGPGGNKYIRTLTNGLEFINSVYNAVIMRLDDSGNLTVNGLLYQQNKQVANLVDITNETTRATTIESNLTTTLGTKAPIVTPTFSGQVQVATGENAQGVALYGGNGGRTGYISFYSPANVRLAYMGYIAANSSLNLQCEAGTTGVYLGGDLTVSGNISGNIPAINNLAPKYSPTLTGVVNIDARDANKFQIQGNINHAPEIYLFGYGSKSIRVLNNSFEIINNTYTASLLQLDDGGNLNVIGAVSQAGVPLATVNQINASNSSISTAQATANNAVNIGNNAQTGVNTTYEIATRTKWLKDFGGVGDGVTDNTAAIQNAMNSGLLVLIAPGVYLTSQLSMGVNGSKLRGVGRGGPHDVAPLGPAGVIFKYIGPNGGTLINMAPFSNTKLTDMEITGIELVSGDYPYSTAAAYGLIMSSVQHSLIDIFTFEFTVAAFAMTVTNNLSEAGNCEGNVISTRFRQINTNGTALQLGGTIQGNTCHNTFQTVYGYINNGIGIDFQNADNNQLQQVWIDRITNGNGINLMFRGMHGSIGTLQGGRTNIIKQFSQSIHTGTIYSEGTETNGVTIPAYGNRIEVFDNANVGIDARTGVGATFYWSGNLNPIGMQDFRVNTYDGYYQHSSGLIEFWGQSTGLFGTGQSNRIVVPFYASRILTVMGNALGQTSQQASCYDFGSNAFTLYSPVYAYYSWVGKAIV